MKELYQLRKPMLLKVSTLVEKLRITTTELKNEVNFYQKLETEKPQSFYNQQLKQQKILSFKANFEYSELYYLYTG